MNDPVILATERQPGTFLQSNIHPAAVGGQLALAGNGADHRAVRQRRANRCTGKLFGQLRNKFVVYRVGNDQP